MKLFLAHAHSLNPFDLKAALLAGHAQHPVIIHFPIGLFIASVVFDLLAVWRKQPILAAVAYYDLLGAAIHDLGRVPGPIGFRRFRIERRLTTALREHGPFDVLHGYWGLPAGVVTARAGSNRRQHHSRWHLLAALGSEHVVPVRVAAGVLLQVVPV